MQQPDGTFTFAVDVQAVLIGLSGGLRQGDLVTPSKPIPNLIRAAATTDFVGGKDAELNADLVNRLELGIAAKSWSNGNNVAALIRQQAGFSDAIVSVVGAGAPEMLRDKHSLFPLAYGNRVDAYRHPSRIRCDTTAAGRSDSIGCGGSDNSSAPVCASGR